MKKGTAIFEVVAGVEGPSFYVGDETSGYRLAGPKPWGGGTSIHRFVVDIAKLRKELDSLDAPPQHKPLTDEQINELRKAYLRVSELDGYSIHGQWEFARAIEAAHGIKEKNT